MGTALLCKNISGPISHARQLEPVVFAEIRVNDYKHIDCSVAPIKRSKSAAGGGRGITRTQYHVYGQSSGARSHANLT